MSYAVVKRFFEIFFRKIQLFCGFKKIFAQYVENVARPMTKMYNPKYVVVKGRVVVLREIREGGMKKT